MNSFVNLKSIFSGYLFSSVKSNAITENVKVEIGTIDYSFSWKTTALIVTTVALAALASAAVVAISVCSIPAIASALTFTASTYSAAFVIHLIIGTAAVAAVGAAALLASVPILSGVWAAHNHRDEVRTREYDFALKQKNVDIKLSYLDKAAAKGHKEAIHKEFQIGKEILWDALAEPEAAKRKEKYDKGISVVNKSAKHLNLHIKSSHLAKIQLKFKEKFDNPAKSFDRQEHFNNILNLYWRDLVDNGKYSHFMN